MLMIEMLLKLPIFLIHNDSWIEIYVNFADAQIAHCLEALAGFGVFDVYSVRYDQTTLLE